MRKQLVILSSLAIATLSQANEWSGEGDLGFNQVSGNSESESLAAVLKVGYDTEKWSHLLQLDAFTASQDDSRSAESYSATFQSDYAINEKTYAFGNLRYTTDKFSGYDSQAAATVGLGRHFIDDGVTLFDGEIGAGYRTSELSTGEEEEEAIYTAKLVFNRALTDNTTFESLALAESGEENTYVEGNVSLKVAMSESLALRLAYTAKHNTDVPDGTEKTDKYTTITLNYTF